MIARELLVWFPSLVQGFRLTNTVIPVAAKQRDGLVPQSMLVQQPGAIPVGSSKSKLP